MIEVLNRIMGPTKIVPLNGCGYHLKYRASFKFVPPKIVCRPMWFPPKIVCESYVGPIQNSVQVSHMGPT